MWKAKTKRLIIFTFGVIFFALGFIGMFLPLLPTTPFMLLALWAFSNSSQKWHDYIWHHPRFGQTVRDWKTHGIMSRRAKRGSAIVMSISAGWLVFFSSAPTWAIASAVLTMSITLTWLLTRPEQVASTASEQ